MALTSAPPLPSSVASLLRFFARARLQGQSAGVLSPAGQMAWFVLDGHLVIPFWINPQTYRETSAAIYANLVTPGLVRRSYFSAKPQILSLEGTTGTAGWDARQGGMFYLGKIKPFVGRRGTQIEFHYPYMFPQARYCYVNRFVQEVTPDSPLMYYYQIELSCYPQGAALACQSLLEARPAPARYAPIVKKGPARAVHPPSERPVSADAGDTAPPAAAPPSGHELSQWWLVPGGGPNRPVRTAPPPTGTPTPPPGTPTPTP